ncbi:MAG: glucose-6-phosphate dehydrogenase assembly protein OpcA, partial [Alphaproteobacteria bacterium]
MADALNAAAPATTASVGSDWTEARAVDVAAIERELESMLGRSDEPRGGVPTRARMSNLVVFATREGAEGGLNESLAEVAGRHPSRVLLLVADPDLGEAPQAWVSALCRGGDGGRRICSEQVSIRAGGDGVRRLPSVVRPLLVGDLPTALWWAVPTPPTFSGEIFHELAEMAQRVLWDSADWADDANGLRSVGRWAEGVDSRVGLGDLAWSRLGPWRASVARALGPTATVVTKLRIAHGPHALPKALLLAGWLADRLGWRRTGRGEIGPSSARWTFDASGRPVTVEVVRVGEGPPSVLEVVFETTAAAAPRVAIRRGGDGRLEVDPPVPGGSLGPAPIGAPGELVARELPDLDGDPLFRSALAAAR